MDKTSLVVVADAGPIIHPDELPKRTTLHIRPALLAEVIANVEANAK
jgi:hypothetical protein